MGAFVDGKVVDLNSAYELYLKEVEGRDYPERVASAIIPPSMIGFLQGGIDSFKIANKILRFLEEKRDPDLVGLDGERIFLEKEQIKLCAPVPKPGKVYCMAVNYYDHVTERIKDLEKRRAEIERLKSLNIDVPIIFQKPPSLVCGPDAPIIKPRNSNKVDYECELAVVIGKKGKYIPKERAYEHIAGYTIFIDVSFRDQGFPEDVEFDMYKRDINWTKGKGMDNAAPMGPCIVTKDEIPNPYDPPLRLVTRVNGQERQNNDTSWMIISIPRIIEYLSNGTTLEPGDVIATGTVAGVAGSWPDGFLKIGDLVECEIQPIGVLKHKVIGD
ncbi:fumarylacetoacetate hydrolase family protein [Candidatus Bathyarchaeota archaeon]|nr:fumarylacetoacetate hydrolase family protein [Candidatus Bathyarchaeota archaeon]MBS7631035.1 fumarylacetoacetate hydrolase family protein [Candidatus Bathyarchaeota archaeon]